MDYDEIMIDVEDRMEKAVDVFRNELRGMRTGRAHPGLVEPIRVDYYGSPTPLKQIASISGPEADQIGSKPSRRRQETGPTPVSVSQLEVLQHIVLERRQLALPIGDLVLQVDDLPFESVELPLFTDQSSLDVVHVAPGPFGLLR